MSYLPLRGPAPLAKPRSQRAPVVYVAGPYSKGDVMVNIREAMRMGQVLIDAGYVVFVPHLSAFQHLVDHRPYREWLDYDFRVILCCDAVLRLPGESPGADEEVAFAVRNGIPVHSALETLYACTPAAKRLPDR